MVRIKSEEREQYFSLCNVHLTT